MDKTNLDRTGFEILGASVRKPVVSDLDDVVRAAYWRATWVSHTAGLRVSSGWLRLVLMCLVFFLK